MRARRKLVQSGAGILVVLAAHTTFAQHACFGTAAEAAAQAAATTPAKREGRVQAGEGFRLEAVQHDPLRAGNWATVAWCGHPERPALLLRVAGSVPELISPTATLTRKSQAPPAVRAGSQVLVVWAEALVHMEAAGTALASAAVGERLKVRLGEQRLVEGTVRDGQTIEVE